MQLPPVLDGQAAPALHQEFMQRRGKPLKVDASNVQLLGGQCLAVLLAARNAWAADAKPLVFEHGSDAFADTLELLGASLETDK